MSRIVTFYSYKGGVGRTFSLANIAVLLAQNNHRVLVIDADLEAPGLHRYFDRFSFKPSREGLVHLLHAAYRDPNVNWRSYAGRIPLSNDQMLTILCAGDGDANYSNLVRDFSWNDFFGNRQGGSILDRWRDEWRSEFDFVLIDSRTGITDSGGVCTVLMPDILVLVFAANNQSFRRGVEVLNSIQESRRELSIPRPPVAVLPLAGRFDARVEVDEAKRWLEIFSRELKPFFDDWLPRRFNPAQILELTKLPYVAKCSFGEPLTVLEHGTTDPDFPGFYLANVAKLIESDFKAAAKIIAPNEQTELEQFRTLLKNPERSVDEIVKALEQLSTQPEYSEAAFDALIEATTANLTQSARSDTEKLLNISLEIAERAGSSRAIKLAYNLAALYILDNKPLLARESYLRTIELLELNQNSEPELAISIYRSLGEICQETDRLSEAEDYLLRSLMLAQEHGDRLSVFYALKSLGLMYAETARNERAIEYLSDALVTIDNLEFDSSINQTDLMSARAELLQALSSVQVSVGQLSSAEESIRRAVAASNKLRGDMSAGSLSATIALGKLLRDTGKLGEAEEVFIRIIRELVNLRHIDWEIVFDVYCNIIELMIRSVLPLMEMEFLAR